MPHATFNTAAHNTTAEDFRAWGKAISDAIATVGLVRGSDSGQIDWTTVPLPPPGNDMAGGYEIWHLADDLQAAFPVVIKIEYGTGTSSISPFMWITVGKSTDGAGNVLGTLLARQGVGRSGPGGASSTAVTEGYVATCGGRSCLIVAPFASADSTIRIAPAFIVERSRNNAGEATGDGLMVTLASGNHTSPGLNSSPNSMWAISYAGQTSNTGAVPVVVPYQYSGAIAGGGSSLASGVVAPTFPWVAFAPGLAPWQPLAALSYAQGDAIGGLVTVRLLGADRQYRVIPVANSYSHWGCGVMGASESASATLHGRVGLMILWED